MEILSDAQVYAEHAGKSANAIDTEDVRLAAQSKINSSFSQPPPREVHFDLTGTVQYATSICPSFGYRIFNPSYLLAASTKEHKKSGYVLC